MLNNLKKKLSSAIQEGIVISENLHQHYLQRTPSTPATPTLNESFTSNSLSTIELGISPNVNMAAGCNLLAKYEDDWKAIHDANEENANLAAQVATQIDAIEQRTSAQRVSMTDLITCLGGVPVLVEKLQASENTLKEIVALTATVETELMRLQDLCEECDLQEFMLHKQCELSQRQQKKMAELESYRQQVAARHQAKIQQHEQRLRQIQRERQAVFEDAFHEDLAEFRQRGTITKIHKEPASSPALEEIVLEDATTKDALEEFLSG